MVLQEEAIEFAHAVEPNDVATSGPAFTFSTDLLKPLPARNYLVEPLMPEGSIVVVGGYGSSAKTWFTTSLALAVAHGTPWLERFDTTPTPPVLFDYEAGEYESRRRIQALSAGMVTSDPVDIALCVHPAYALNSPEFPVAFERVLTERRFVVIDSLRAATPGIDENDSNIRRYVDGLRRIPGFDRTCIVLLAHARKGGGDAREQLRGSGAIFDSADQVLFLKAEGDATFSVQQTKSRFGPEIEPFEFMLQDGKNGSVRLVEVLSSAGGKTASVDRSLLKRVLHAVTAQPGITATELRNRVKGRASRVDEAAAALRDLGKIAPGARKGSWIVGKKADANE